MQSTPELTWEKSCVRLLHYSLHRYGRYVIAELVGNTWYSAPRCETVVDGPGSLRVIIKAAKAPDIRNGTTRSRLLDRRPTTM